MTLFVVGLSHKTAPVELREQLAVDSSNLVPRARQLKAREDLDEVMLLSTCNRVEIYAVTRGANNRAHTLLESLCSEQLDLGNHTYVYEGLEAVRHLFRVAAGLDSMVLGETEITGQVKKAYEIAHAARLTAGTLNRLFQNAFQVAKEIRAHTCIGRGATSVGGVAVALAERIFRHDLSGQSVLIIGGGQMGENCLRHLVKKGARSILVANRSFDRAVELAGEFGGRPVRFEESLSAMAASDIVLVSSGGEKTLFHCADVEAAIRGRRDRPLVLIDISVPRKVDPRVQYLNNVYLCDIDDLEAIVRENAGKRERELVLCDQIIDARAFTLMARLESTRKELHEAGVAFQSTWLPRTAAAAG